MEALLTCLNSDVEFGYAVHDHNVEPNLVYMLSENWQASHRVVFVTLSSTTAWIFQSNNPFFITSKVLHNLHLKLDE